MRKEYAHPRFEATLEAAQLARSALASLTQRSLFGSVGA